MRLGLRGCWLRLNQGNPLLLGKRIMRVEMKIHSHSISLYVVGLKWSLWTCSGQGDSGEGHRTIQCILVSLLSWMEPIITSGLLLIFWLLLRNCCGDEWFDEGFELEFTKRLNELRALWFWLCSKLTPLVLSPLSLMARNWLLDELTRGSLLP